MSLAAYPKSERTMATVRHSKHIVAFDGRGRGWDVGLSADENSPPPHVSKAVGAGAAVGGGGGGGELGDVRQRQRQPRNWAFETGPEPIRSTSPTIKKRPSRSALAPVSNVNELLLIKEIGALESELARVKRAFLIQDKILNGFCKLRIQE